MRCGVRAKYPSLEILTTIYHFIITAFTQTRDNMHSSYRQHHTRSHVRRHTNSITIHAQLQLNMPGKYPQITVHVAQPFAKDPFIINPQLYLPTVIQFVMTFATQSIYHSHFQYTCTSLCIDICRHTPEFGWEECFYTHATTRSPKCGFLIG